MKKGHRNTMTPMSWRLKEGSKGTAVRADPEGTVMRSERAGGFGH
jgi:hypothetical protein